MTDENCLYCNREGECTKGLPGTPCEVVGCVAHSPVGYLSWGDMTEKEKSNFLYDLSHQLTTLPGKELSKGDLPVQKSKNFDIHLNRWSKRWSNEWSKVYKNGDFMK